MLNQTNKVIDGKAVSTALREKLILKCSNLFAKYAIKPKLAIVLVGEDPASQVYVNSKKTACAQVNILSEVIHLPQTATQEEVENEIKKLASDQSVNGIMVQLPLPKGLDENSAIALIPAEKDVDGLTVLNAGKCYLDGDGFIPCTPKGIMQLLYAYNIPLPGKHAVIVGRSKLVGKPIAMQLLSENCTVTICHSRTQDLSYHTKQAGILIVAVGKKHLINAEMVKNGAVVIDVGINRENGKLYGDIDFDSVVNTASLITPVPGGVGPMTVTMLLTNTFEACLKQNGVKDEF